MNTIIIPILPVNEQIEEIAVECLRRIDLFSKDHRVISVINGENGGSVSFQRQVQTLSSTTHIAKERKGYAKAVNIGLSYVKGNPDFVTIGSCDIYVCENWQNHLQLSNPPALISPLDMSKTREKDVGYRGGFWAAWWTMPYRAFLELGEFDESMNLRYAANDYAIRAHIDGYKLVRALIHFDHVAAKHSSVGEGFQRQIREEERAFRAKWGGAHNYKSWVDNQGGK